jgi:DNA mismatch repair protein PMS2
MGNRIMLMCVPMTTQSNKLLNDIDELLYILSETDLNSGSINSSSSQNSSQLTEIKSSSLRAIFASKACRKSIMIGTSLNKAEMKRVISHLEGIEKPWNCPHGRPTMRHLINIKLLKSLND